MVEGVMGVPFLPFNVARLPYPQTKATAQMGARTKISGYRPVTN